LNVARTLTGSVADVKLPKAKASCHVKLGLSIGANPVNIKRSDDVKIAMNVPKKLKIKTDPKFLKKGFFLML
jgi:hypothetical protein